MVLTDWRKGLLKIPHNLPSEDEDDEDDFRSVIAISEHLEEATKTPSFLKENDEEELEILTR